MPYVTSDSRASDASLRALVDAARVAPEGAPWLIIGGHMVNLHVLRAAVDLPLRATRDADLAVELFTVRDGGLIERLRSLGYDNTTSSNRFDSTDNGLTSSIDIVVPSYTNRLVPNVDAGTIVVDGLPVLHFALERAPVVVELEAEFTGGSRIATRLRIPDVVSAIALKTLAYGQRFAPRDAEDVARLLEVAHADGATAADWPDSSTFTAASRALSDLFDRPGGALVHATGSASGRSRIRALTRSIVGRP